MLNNFLSLLVVLLAFVAAYWLRFGTAQIAPPYMIALLSGLLLSSVIIPASGAFRSEFKWAFFRKIRRLMAGWALVVITLVILAAMLKVSAVYSRIWFGYWAGIGVVALASSQVIAQFWARYQSRTESNRLKSVLVGSGDHAYRVMTRIISDPDNQMDLLGQFGQGSDGTDVLPLSGLAEFIQENDVDHVWIAVSMQDKGTLEQALEQLKDLVVDVNVVPDLYQYRLLNQEITELNGLPVVNLSGTPMSGEEQRLKAMFDWVAAFCLVVILSPLMLLIALGIRLTSSGKAIFRQPRHGLGGESITIYKFRSMRVNDDPGEKFKQAVEGDERVTPIGRFLRRTSLDELPQLFNVLRGELSLVGPRPHPAQLNQQFMSSVPRYMLRHKVKPGMTGWAQVNGLRGVTDTDEKMSMRIDHDLWYIQNWSIWLDIRILMMTPFVMIHRNAV